jgi:hypothetical protein
VLFPITTLSRAKGVIQRGYISDDFVVGGEFVTKTRE